MMRHSWEPVDKFKSRCRRCEGTKLKRPHPYMLSGWVTEYDVPGENGRVIQCDKAPPCTPPSCTPTREEIERMAAVVVEKDPAAMARDVQWRSAMKTVTMFRVYMFNPHQGHLGGMDMPIQARSRKALDKMAEKFESCGCTIKWETLTTVTEER